MAGLINTELMIFVRSGGDRMRRILPMLLLFILFASACNQKADWDISVEQAPFFKKNIKAPFIIKISKNKKAVSNLTVHATFEMEKMNHGFTEVELTEKESGLYEGMVELSMPGEYEVFLQIENGKKQKEEHLTLYVKEEEAIAIINKEKIYEEDIDFYRFIHKLHLAMARDKEKDSGEDTNYWESVDNENMLLTQIIRLRSIALLALEKGFTVSNTEIEAEVNKAKQTYSSSKIAMKMISQFGEEAFWEKEKSEYYFIVLSNKVQQDLISKVKQENPTINENEVMYLAKKQFEDLVISQVNSLNIQLLNN